MNGYGNYLIEANISLALFIVTYLLFLRKETDFKRQRLFLLAAIGASLIFPCFHFVQPQTRIPSLSQFLPTYLLPGITISGNGVEEVSASGNSFNVWSYIKLVYCIGLVFFLIRFIIQIVQLTRILSAASFETVGKFRIFSSVLYKSTFSFFNYIVIGQGEELSSAEKERIIQHEAVHANQFHSVDILLLNILGVLFWFNPFLYWYKKTFIQLHEFEADARAVANHDVNTYCSLLAKVALQSSDFRLANHFNNSLTLKRIKMMRTIKHKLQPWKMIAFASVIPIIFFLVACQDQLTEDFTTIAKNAHNALVVPDNIQSRFDQLKKENPSSRYILVEFNDEADKILGEMEEAYGLPKSIELYTPDSEQYKIRGEASEVKIRKMEKRSDDLQTFAIIEFNEFVSDISSRSKSDGEVFTIVEETASPQGGMPKFYEYVAMKLKYPLEARSRGVTGKVFVEFVIETDGTLSDTKILKGIGSGCDEEALQVIKSSPPWIPGRNNGVAVKQRMVLPILFKLNGEKTIDEAQTPKEAIDELVVVGHNPDGE